MTALTVKGRKTQEGQSGWTSSCMYNCEARVACKHRCSSFSQGIPLFLTCCSRTGSREIRGSMGSDYWTSSLCYTEVWKLGECLHLCLAPSLHVNSHSLMKRIKSNHLQQHICLKRKHQHEDLATLNQLKEEHLPDILIVVILIVHLPFFLWFVLLAYLFHQKSCKKNLPRVTLERLKSTWELNPLTCTIKSI